MIEENCEKINKKITVALVLLVLLIVALVGITYAYFSAKSNAVPQPVTTAKVDLFVEVDPNATHVKDIKPTSWNNTVTENDGNNDVVRIPIKVTNRSTIDINYDLFITPDGLALNEEGLDGDEQQLVGGDLSDIKYKLYEVTGTSLSEEPIIEGDFTKGEKKQKIVANKEIKAQKEESSDNIQNYILYIYIENLTSEQNKLQGIDFNLDIEGVTPIETLSQAVLRIEDIVEENPEFIWSSQDRGLYKLQGDIAADENGNNIKDIYYYRGSVENNYVQFGTYTNDVYNEVFTPSSATPIGGTVSNALVATKGSPILWRIVRINEDGSVKLIAEHNIGDSYHVWNSVKVSDYVNEDDSDSEIKKIVEDWYKETFVNPIEEYEDNKKLEKLVKESKLCNDRSDDYKGVYNRLNSFYEHTPEPTLNCSNPDDIIKAKAGLITADEMTYAGALLNISRVLKDNITYLNNNTFFWTMSPYLNYTVDAWRPSDRYIIDCSVNYTDCAAARPVITLSADAKVTSGDGSLEKPYVIKSN